MLEPAVEMGQVAVSEPALEEMVGSVAVLDLVVEEMGPVAALDHAVGEMGPVAVLDPVVEEMGPVAVMDPVVFDLDHHRPQHCDHVVNA